MRKGSLITGGGFHGGAAAAVSARITVDPTAVLVHVHRITTKRECEREARSASHDDSVAIADLAFTSSFISQVQLGSREKGSRWHGS